MGIVNKNKSFAAWGDMYEPSNKIRKKSDKKWKAIDETSYLKPSGFYPFNPDILIYTYGEVYTNNKIAGYMKNDVLCFYFAFCHLSFHSHFYKNPYQVFFDVFKSIEEYLVKTNYKGKVGFELTSFEQLNKIAEEMINRYGYITERKNGIVITNF